MGNSEKISSISCELKRELFTLTNKQLTRSPEFNSQSSNSLYPGPGPGPVSFSLFARIWVKVLRSFSQIYSIKIVRTAVAFNSSPITLHFRA